MIFSDIRDLFSNKIRSCWSVFTLVSYITHNASLIYPSIHFFDLYPKCIYFRKAALHAHVSIVIRAIRIKLDTNTLINS